MTYLVTDNCIHCKHTDCVSVCPVDCFYEAENFLAINPEECIDCGVCEPECPVDAIVQDGALTPQEAEKWEDINRKVAQTGPNIVDVKDPYPGAETWNGYPNKYEELGIISIKEVE